VKKRLFTTLWMKRQRKFLEIEIMANLLELSDQEIIDIANPLWEDLIRTSNNKDYGGFTKNFSKKMLMGADEVTLGKQWAIALFLQN